MKKILLFIIMTVFLVGCSSASEETSTNEVQETQAQQTEYKTGDTITVEGIENTLNNVRTEIDGDKKYIYFDITLHNTNDKNKLISSGDYKVLDEGNRKYDNDITYKGCNGKFVGELAVDGTVRGEISYILPIDSKQLQLQVSEVYTNELEIFKVDVQ